MVPVWFACEWEKDGGMNGEWVEETTLDFAALPGLVEDRKNSVSR